MQEVHCNNKNMKIWQTEWGSRWYASYGTTSARGTVIMFNNLKRNKIEVTKSVSDHEGRNVIVNIKYNDQEYTISNIYAPNDDSPSFFSRMAKSISKVAKENVIVGGNFNLVLDTKIDRLNSTCNNHKTQESLHNIMDELQLIDVWRTRNEDASRFTWFKKTGGLTSASRIDFFLINVGMNQQVVKTEINYGCRTDHSLIQIEIYNKEIKRGPGVWKFNNLLLNHTDFTDKMRKNLIEMKNKLQGMDLDAIDDWEAVKIKVYDVCKKHTKKSTKKKNCTLQNLYKLQQIMQEESCTKNKTNEHEEHVHEIESKITEIENEKIRASMFQSKCKYVKCGEKNTSYYFALEKHNFMNKNSFTMYIKGTLCKDQRTILEEQRKFYQKLYTADPSIKFSLKNETGITLSEEQKTEKKRSLLKRYIMPH